MTLAVPTAAVAEGTVPPSSELTPRRTFSIELHEFTRPHIDVSPDGETLIFDVLGDIFVAPLEGGKASLLIGGPSWDRSPQWSPDGRAVSFLSDRVGASNIWTFDLRTAAVRQVTTFDDPRRYGVEGAPSWSRDGTALFGTYGARTPQARQVYGFAAGEGQALGPIARNWSGISEGRSTVMSYMGTPSFAPDDSTAYLDITHIHRNAFPGRMVSISTTLAELDMRSGAVREIPSQGNADEFSPRVSRSGRFLAFGRQTAGRPADLILRDLETGQDRKLTELQDVTAFSTGQWEDDAIPAFAFTPDDELIIISDGGKIVSVRVADGAKEEIPITVALSQDLAEPIRGMSRIDRGPLRPRAIRWPAWSPSAQKWYFSAVGCLWVMGAPEGATALAPCEDEIATMPAISPDGSKMAFIAYAVDKDAISDHGTLKIRDISSGDLLHTSPDVGYSVPAWSPDGHRLAVIREQATGDERSATFGWIDVSTGRFHPVAEANSSGRWDYRGAAAQAIHFTADSQHLVYTTGAPAGGGHSSLFVRKVGLDGADPAIIAIGRPDIRGASVSPDLAKVVALGWDNKVYLGTIPAQSGSPLVLSTAGISLEELPAASAFYVNWIDSEKVSLGWLNELSVYDASTRRLLERASVALEVPRRGHGAWEAYALTHVRAITMDGPREAGRVIDDATILISNGVIAAVGRSDNVVVPDGTLIIPGTGWTVVPGLVETHMHGLLGGGNTSTWGYPKVPSPDLATGIAYGVTTAWDGFGSYDDAALERTELIEAGLLLGPRWVHAGGGFAGWIDNGGAWSSVGGVRSLVTHAAELGAPCLKHNNWYVRRWTRELAETARRHGLCVIGHGANGPQMLSLIADGIALDHFSLPERSYADVIEFVARSNLPWTPHAWGAGASYRGPQVTAARSFIDELRTSHPKQWDKLRRYGQAHIDSLDYLPSIPYADTAAFDVARLAARVASKGGVIVASADTAGNYAQIQIHAEIWGFARAGMSNGEALRTATLNGAIKLGLEDQLGSIEAGKLADLIVLERNPLEEIEASLSIEYTIIGGRIYDAQTVEHVPAAELAN